MALEPVILLPDSGEGSLTGEDQIGVMFLWQIGKDNWSPFL